jgi:4-amino-4-deoxy-L-arabinose transferase-like glycosyltransferase
MNPQAAGERRPLALWLVGLAVAAGLLAYSQTVAYFGNEPFHLLAAQLINRGKQPYLDFFYQHAPLYAYLNAVWMRVFGESWRSAHVLSALLASGCVVLIADYVFARLPARARLAAAMVAALLIGLNFYVLCFATVGLPFGLCLFFTAAAFRLTAAAVDPPRPLRAFAAGLCASVAAASSLLTAPEVIVFLIWMFHYNRAGSRLKKGVAYLAGAAIPFLPLAWLLAQSPRQTLFNVVGYHLFYRVQTGGSMLRWNLREIVEWFVTYQGWLLVSLAATGLWFAVRRSEPGARRKAELYLCAWLIAVLSVWLSLPRPTFAFYFILLTPFITILAALGFYEIAARLRLSTRAGWLMLALIVLYAGGLAGRVYKSRLEILYADHKAIEAVARQVNQITPPDGWLYAFEQVYFEARRLPPPGLENGFNPFSRANEWLAEGRFDTVCMMANDPRVTSLDLFGAYAKNKAIETHNFTLYIFWEKTVRPSAAR